MTKPRTLAAILLLSALATPALAQGAGGPDDATPPASAQPSTGTPPAPPATGPTPSGTEPATPRPAVIHNPTAQAQEWLQQLGLYSGDVDGKSGPQTRAAVVDFQRSHGLRPTGTLDVATLGRLREVTQTPQPDQANNAGQNPAADTGAGSNMAQTPPPARRPPGYSTNPGSSTSPGRSTTARATVTAPGIGIPGMAGIGTAPGMGYGTSTAESGAASTPGFGAGTTPSFFGTPLDLSNGYNAAIGQGR